jgi:hypothetical protein
LLKVPCWIKKKEEEENRAEQSTIIESAVVRKKKYAAATMTERTWEALDAMPDGQKRIVIKHLKWAGELYKWTHINSYLINELHQKKCSVSAQAHSQYDPPNDPFASQFYHRVCFRGNEEITNFSHFKSALEDVMLQEAPRSHRPINDPLVYYNHESKPSELKFDDFDREDWTLDGSTQAMTVRDRRICQRFVRSFLRFLQDCVRRMKKQTSVDWRTCEQETQGLKQLFAPIIAP